MAIGIYMSASKEIKQAGIKSLAYACRLSDVPRSTVNDWYRTKPKLFRVFLLGVLAIERENQPPKHINCRSFLTGENHAKS